MVLGVWIIVAAVLLVLLLFLALARHGLVALCLLTLLLLIAGGWLLGFRQARIARVRALETQRVEELLQHQELVRQRLRAVESFRASPSFDRLHGDRSLPPGPLPPPVAMAQQLPEATTSSRSVAEIDNVAAIESLATAAEAAAASAPLAAEPSGPAPPDTPPAPAAAPAADPPAAAAVPVAEPTASGADARPDWVQTPPTEIDGQPAQVLVSDPFETGAECDVDMQRRIRLAIQNYADLHATGVGAPAELSLPVQPDDIRQVSQKRFVDVIQTSVGPMKQVHQLIVFDEPFRRVLDRRISEAIVGQRLVQTGVFSGTVLLLVGSLFGILKGGAARRQARTVSA